MNPRAVLLIVVVIAAVVVFVGWLFWRQAGVRRRQFAKVEHERDALRIAVRAIADKADLYRDLDSVLATDVRLILEGLSIRREHQS